MGYMTSICILNDGWDLIKKNPDEFLDAIQKGMVTFNDKAVSYHSIKNFSSPVMVSRSKHADIPQLHLAHMNSMISLNDPMDYTKNSTSFQCLQNSLITAQRILDDAKEQVENTVCCKVLEDIIREGNDIHEMDLPEIQKYFEKSEWVNYSLSKSLPQKLKKKADYYLKLIQQ